jgi:photosystem II stability/assembly factor-like uncharacterized protein
MKNSSDRFRRWPGVVATVWLLTAGPLSGASWTASNAGLPNSFFGITSLTIDPSTPSTLYAISPKGGLFKSTDAAASWTGVSGIADLSFLAIDPNNSLTIYAATQHGVVKSVDGGASWNAANGNLTDSCFLLAIDPVTPGTVYGLTTGGIFKTADGGQTWMQIYASPNWVGSWASTAGSLIIDPTTPSTIYASAIDAGIIKSMDGGQTWVTIKTGLPYTCTVFSASAIPLAVDPQVPSNLYAGSFAASRCSTAPGVPPVDLGTGRISKSTDGGQTWIAVSAGIPSDAFIGSLVLDPGSISTIYAGYASYANSSPNPGGILKSTDGGQTWTVINIAAFGTAIAAVDPQTPSTVYAAYSGLGGTGTISKSTDAGSTWQASNEGLGYYDLHTLAIDPVTTTTVYTGGAGGVFKSNDAGANWNSVAVLRVSSGYPIGAGATDVRQMLVNFKSPNVLYTEVLSVNGCAFDEKTVFKSMDGGVDWSNSISPPDSGCDLGGYSAYTTLMVMDPTNPDTLYLGETEDEDGIYALLKSTDGGGNWTSIWNYANGLQSGLNALAIDAVTPTNLYAGTYTGVFKSTDGGASWNATPLNTFVRGLTIARTDPSILFAATTGGLSKSTDAGATWAAIDGGLSGLARASITAVVIAPNVSNIVYAATSEDGVYKSVDGGGNWVRFNDGLTNLNIRALAIDPGTPTTLYAVTPGGVLRAVDASRLIQAHEQ